MTTIIDGKKIAQDLRNSLKLEIDNLRSSVGKVPGLAVVQVGNVAASSVYVKAKTKSAKEVGIEVIDHHIGEETTEKELLELVNKLNNQENVNVIQEHEVKEYDGFNIALSPWINPENYADAVDFLKTANASWCMGHFEFEGALMMPGMTCQHGLDHSYVKRFEKVLSGHFHQKSEFANIKYLGSQMQFTWSDYGDNKYFHIFDTDTQELTPVLNPITMFEKSFYNDEKETFETISNADYTKYTGKFVKVIVVNKENPYWFDTFLDKLHSANPLHVAVVDDNKHMDFYGDDDIEDIEDTLTILNNYIDGLEIQGKKKPLSELMTSLYNEALDEHNYL